MAPHSETWEPIERKIKIDLEWHTIHIICPHETVKNALGPDIDLNSDEINTGKYQNDYADYLIATSHSLSAVDFEILHDSQVLIGELFYCSYKYMLIYSQLHGLPRMF